MRYPAKAAHQVKTQYLHFSFHTNYLLFTYLGRFQKKLAGNQCSSITKGSIYHIKYYVLKIFYHSSGLTKMLNGSINYVLHWHCVFTRYGSIEVPYLPEGAGDHVDIQLLPCIHDKISLLGAHITFSFCFQFEQIMCFFSVSLLGYAFNVTVSCQFHHRVIWMQVTVI